MLNDSDQGSVDSCKAPYEKSKVFGFRGSVVARHKLKGIDKRSPLGVEFAA